MAVSRNEWTDAVPPPPPASHRNSSASLVPVTARPPGARNGLDWALCGSILPGGGPGRSLTKGPCETSQNEGKVIPSREIRALSPPKPERPA